MHFIQLPHFKLRIIPMLKFRDRPVQKATMTLFRRS